MKREIPIIGICAAGIQKTEAVELIQVICKYARQHGYRVMLYATTVKLDRIDQYAKGEATIFEYVSMEKLSAVVILGEMIDSGAIISTIIRRAKMCQVPVINVGYEEDGCFNIRYDYRSAFLEICEDVIGKHQAKNPFFLAGFEGNDYSEERIDIFMECLNKHGLPMVQEHVAYGDFWEDPAREVCNQWMENTEDVPDAIICANDIMALTACSVLKEHHLKVPEDVIVTGFDGYELEHYCSPRLTTAEIDLELVGKRVNEIVQECLNDRELEPYDEVIPFVARFSESCGCTPIQIMNPNNLIMQVYTRLAQQQHNEAETFSMMNHLTEGHSVMDMLEMAKEYINQKTPRDMAIYVNRRFCRHTDIMLPKDFQMGSLLYLLEKTGEKITIPVREVLPEDRDELLQKCWEQHSQILFMPLHWQEESYGYLAIGHEESDLDYGVLSEFMMSIAQIFGTVRKQSHLHEMYLRDSLTELYNRRGFYSELERQIKKLEGVRKMCYLASVDLDGLKQINDEFGHSEGDYAIRLVSEAMIEVAEEQAICARFGGDEFAVVCIWPMKGMPRNYDAVFQSRIEEALHSDRNKKNYHIDVSIGSVTKEIQMVSDIDAMMREADKHMYRVKKDHHFVRDTKRQ